MTELEAAFFYGDFRDLNSQVQKDLLENRQAIVYNIIFADEEIGDNEVVKIQTWFSEVNGV